jgi:glycosyltransferase involved in cell wall biosynthesis
MTLPTVSAVIVTYNRRDRLAEAVTAIGRDGHASEIVVVVDGCRDGSYELLSDLAGADPRIRPVWQENAGDAAARQTGVRHAGGEVVLVLDDDVIAGPGLAEGHARVHARGPGTVALGYMPVRRPAVRRPGSFASLLYADEYEAQCRRYEADPSTILRSFWTGNVSMRREDALRVGFDAAGRRLGYHGDQAFGLRCLRDGLVGIFDRSLFAEHLHERDMDTFVRQSRMRGADRRVLEELFPELVAPGNLQDDLPLPVRAAVALAAAPGLCRLTAPALRWQAGQAGRARLWRLESALARCLRQVELRRGYRDYRASGGPDRDH